MGKRMEGKRIRGTLLAAMVLLISLLVGGCADTFIVTKDGRSYYFGSNKEGFRKIICESGDLKVILTDTQLTQTLKDDLYKYSCLLPVESSKEQVRKLYASITCDERRDLRMSFQKHGYDINWMAC